MTGPPPPAMGLVWLLWRRPCAVRHYPATVCGWQLVVHRRVGGAGVIHRRVTGPAGRVRASHCGRTGSVGLPGIPRRIVMSQGGYVTLVGFVAQDPIQRPTKDGVLVTDLRVGATPRVQDRVTNQWRDGETSYYDVSCWRRLGDHVRASLHKGDPVMIKGKFRSRTFTDKAGVSRTAIDIVADTVGHDL